MSPITFQFYVFGPPRLCIDDETITLPPQPAALCAFLILNRQRRITREQIPSITDSLSMFSAIRWLMPMRPAAR